VGEEQQIDGLPPGGALARAVLACDSALLDYQAGLLDDGQLRRILFHSGIVLDDGGAWLLDVERGAWCRYDGIAAGDHADRPLDGATIRRWRAGLRRLATDAALESHEGDR
jgi:hypothetical protein